MKRGLAAGVFLLVLGGVMYFSTQIGREEPSMEASSATVDLGASTSQTDSPRTVVPITTAAYDQESDAESNSEERTHGAQLRVTVKGRRQRMLERYSISVQSPEFLSVEPSRRHYGVSEFRDLEPSRYTLVVWATGYEPYRQVIEVVPGARLQELGVQLQSKLRLHIRVVTPEGVGFVQAASEQRGLPVDDLRVRVFQNRQLAGGPLPSNAGDGENDSEVGYFIPRREARDEIEDMDPETIGWVGFFDQPGGFVHLLVHDFVLAEAPVAPGQTKATLELPVATLVARYGSARFRPLGLDGKPPPPRELAVVLDSQGLLAARLPRDEEGHFLLSWLSVGPHALRLKTFESGETEVPFLVEGTKRCELGDLVLEHPSNLAGQILDAEGKPVAGEVRVYRAADDGSPLNDSFYKGRVEFDGRFEVTGIPRGRYCVRAYEGSWMSGDVVVDTRDANQNDILLRLRPAYAAHLVVETASIEPVEVTITNSDRRVVYRWRHDRASHYLPLHLGTYQFTAATVGGRSQTVPLEIPRPEDELTLTLRL